MLKVSKNEVFESWDWAQLRKVKHLILEFESKEANINVASVSKKILLNLTENYPTEIINDSLKIRSVKNIRGYSIDNVKNEEILFSINGDLYLTIDDPTLITTPLDKLKKQNFNYSIKTKFNSFNGGDNINYDLLVDASAELSSISNSLRPLDFIDLLPAKISTIFFGIEFFSPGFLGNLIGSVPSVDRKLFFEITNKSILFEAFASSKKLNYSYLENLLDNFKKSIETS